MKFPLQSWAPHSVTSHDPLGGRGSLQIPLFGPLGPRFAVSLSPNCLTLLLPDYVEDGENVSKSALSVSALLVYGK